MWKYTTKDQINEFLLSLKLLNYNEEKYINTLYAISNNVEKNYKVYKIKKNNGKYRKIYAPNKTLKHIQRAILNNILNHKSISKYARAYHKGLSLKDNATPHVGNTLILKLDIEDFFGNIDFMDVYNSCFPIEYFPKSIGMLLTYLCTYDEYLPQGAPTSAYISNLVMKDFDEIIGKWCEEMSISYTRYSDDMTFSGNFDPYIVIKKVMLELKSLGLKLNKDKIHIVRNSQNQSVTGVTVNKKAQASKKYRNKIRQEVYYIKKYGIESHLKHLNIDIDKNYYLHSLLGKINFVLDINDLDKEFIKYKEDIKSLLTK